MSEGGSSEALSRALDQAANLARTQGREFTISARKEAEVAVVDEIEATGTSTKRRRIVATSDGATWTEDWVRGPEPGEPVPEANRLGAMDRILARREAALRARGGTLEVVERRPAEVAICYSRRGRAGERIRIVATDDGRVSTNRTSLEQPRVAERQRMHGCLIAFLIVLAIVVIAIGICLAALSNMDFGYSWGTFC